MTWKEILKNEWDDSKLISKGKELLKVDWEKLTPATGDFEHKCRIWLEKYNDVENTIEFKRTGRKKNPVIMELKDKISRKYHDALKARKEYQ